MGRKKIQIKKIDDPKTKSVTFTRRRNGLLKKAYEISVLCDTRVVILMFDQKNACHVYSTMNEENSAVDMMNMYINKSFVTADPRRTFEIPANIAPDPNGIFRTSPSRNQIAVVNTYEVVPALSDGEQQIDDGDPDGSEQLRVLSNRLYHSVSIGNRGVNLVTPALTNDGDTLSPRVPSTGFPTPELNTMTPNNPAGLGILPENPIPARDRSASPQTFQSHVAWKKPMMLQSSGIRQPSMYSRSVQAKYQSRVQGMPDPQGDRNTMDASFSADQSDMTCTLDVSNPAVYSDQYFGSSLSSHFQLQQMASQKRMMDIQNEQESSFHYPNYGAIYPNDPVQLMGENWLGQSPDTNQLMTDQRMAWM